MPSGWDVYYVVLLSAVFALSLPLALRLAAMIVSARPPGGRSRPVSLPDAPLALGRRINTRFFLGANAALLLISFGLILIPCVGALKRGEAREALGGMISILSLAAFAALGLLYSARKGDLNWLKSLRGGRQDG